MSVDELEVESGETVASGLRTRAIREGSLFLACKWAAQLLSWGATLGVARLLLPADYGVMAAAGMVLGLSDLLAEAGVGKALVQKDKVTDSDLAEAFGLSLIISTSFYLMAVAVAGPSARFLRTPELVRVIPIMGIAILLVPFRTIPLGILDRRLELKAQGLVNVFLTILQSSLVLGLALLGARFWALVAGAVVSRLAEGLALAYVARWTPRAVVPGRGAARLLRFGTWMSLGSLLWYVYSNSDFAVVGRLEGPIVLGYYSFAFQLMSLPAQKVTANVNQMIFPVFCRLQGDRPRIKDWYMRLTVLMISFVLPTLLGAALVAQDGFVTLFGSKWLPAVLPFQILSAVGLLSALSSSLISLLLALGRPDVHFKYTAACAVVFPLAFVVAGTWYGVVGVCLAWLLTYTLAVALLIRLTGPITGLSLGEIVLAQFPVLRAGALMAVVVLGAQVLLGSSVSAPVRLVVAVLLGAVSYGGCLLLTARETVLADMKIVLRELRG